MLFGQIKCLMKNIVNNKKNDRKNDENAPRNVYLAHKSIYSLDRSLNTIRENPYKPIDAVFKHNKFLIIHALEMKSFPE